MTTAFSEHHVALAAGLATAEMIMSELEAALQIGLLLPKLSVGRIKPLEACQRDDCVFGASCGSDCRTCDR